MVGLKSLKMDHIYIYIYSEPLPIGNKVWVTTVFLLVMLINGRLPQVSSSKINHYISEYDNNCCTGLSHISKSLMSTKIVLAMSYSFRVMGHGE